MKKKERTYTVFKLDEGFRDEDGSMRIIEDKGCGHKHKTLIFALRCRSRKRFPREGVVNSKWFWSRIRENTSGYIYMESSSDDFRRRTVYRTGYIDGKSFFTSKHPDAPPEIFRLFDKKVRAALTPLERLRTALLLMKYNFTYTPFKIPHYLGIESLDLVIAYQNELEMCDENPMGNKSQECTCAYCGKGGFLKKIEPKTLHTHKQKCNACGGKIMIDSYYYDKHFRNEKEIVMPEQKSPSYFDEKIEEPEMKTMSFLSLDDAKLGKMVKGLAASIQDHKGYDSASFTACATLIACITAGRNSTSANIDLAGITDANQQVGDWKLTVRRVSAPPEQEVLQDISNNGLSSVWVFEQNLDRTNLAVFHRQSDGKYIPVSDGEYGEPVETKAAAMVIAYQMRLKQVTDYFENEISKIPKIV